MKRRCYNRKDHYKYYGAKDIAICARWLLGENGKSGVECFLSDMGTRPAGLTLQRISAAGRSWGRLRYTGRLQRIDINGNFSPENCRGHPMTRPRKRVGALNGEVFLSLKLRKMPGVGQTGMNGL
jgi:hypothetical protein